MATRHFIFVLPLLVLIAGIPADAEERLAVIVSADRTAELSLDEVAQIFLKKRRFWHAGESIVPVNRNATSAAREVFTKLVFHQEARFLQTYWNRQYYDGILPPVTLASDEAVKRFVAREPNAIGYIDETLVDDSVRVVLVLDSTVASAP
jgi:ABC-type phosphate transport system substrate-binding protein